MKRFVLNGSTVSLSLNDKGVAQFQANDAMLVRFLNAECTPKRTAGSSDAEYEQTLLSSIKQQCGITELELLPDAPKPQYGRDFAKEDVDPRDDEVKAQQHVPDEE